MTSRFLIPASVAPLDVDRAQRRYLDQLLTPPTVVLRCIGCGLTRFETTPVCDANPTSSHRFEPLECLACRATDGVAFEDPRTAYEKRCKRTDCLAGGYSSSCEARHANKTDCPNWPKEDPNTPIPLCRHCARVHHEEMNDRDAEYRAGQM
jgi:hypothetical protein